MSVASTWREIAGRQWPALRQRKLTLHPTESTSRDKLPSSAWLVVALLWVVGCLNYLDRGMITTMRGSLAAAIPMSDTQFGLLTSLFLWVYGLLSPFAGPADRRRRNPCRPPTSPS
jgi:sugar phosphate permease